MHGRRILLFIGFWNSSYFDVPRNRYYLIHRDKKKLSHYFKSHSSSVAESTRKSSRKETSWHSSSKSAGLVLFNLIKLRIIILSSSTLSHGGNTRQRTNTGLMLQWADMTRILLTTASLSTVSASFSSSTPCTGPCTINRGHDGQFRWNILIF